MVAMLLQAIGGAPRKHIIDDFELSESELLLGAAGGDANDADDARQFSRVTQQHYLSTAEDGNANAGLSAMSTLTGPSTPTAGTSALAMTIYTFQSSV